MKAATKSRPEANRSAMFLSPGATYHADRCESLRHAVARKEIKLAALCRRGYPGRLLPAGMLPEVSTVGYWDAARPQTWGLDWHRNEGIEITFLARGKTAFQVGRERFDLSAGQLTITRPWQEHRVGDPNIGPSRLHWLILDVGVRRPDETWVWPDWMILSPADCAKLTRLLSHNEQPVWQANPEILECFEKIAQCVQQSDPLAVQTRIQLSINELFLALLELLQKKRMVLNAELTSTRRTVEMFLNALPSHVDHPWTLEEMAQRCGLGRSRFSDYCRQITNLTPSEYLAECRVEAARNMLLTKAETSITDVAFACGFESSQYFATVFRRKTGLSPRDYKAENAGKRKG